MIAAINVNVPPATSPIVTTEETRKIQPGILIIFAMQNSSIKRTELIKILSLNIFEMVATVKSSVRPVTLLMIINSRIKIKNNNNFCFRFKRRPL